MTDQWGRFEKRSGQTIRDLGGEGAIEITNGTATYDGIGEGDSYSYPGTADATLDAETLSPSAVSGVDDSGTFEGIDQLVWVDDDTTETIVGYGDTDEPPTRITVLENGETFEVQEKVTTGDGYYMLKLTEI